MFKTFCYTATFVVLGGLFAQLVADEVDKGEVARWGDTVQHVAGDAKHGEERQASDAASDVFGTPPDDNHKWFISIVGMKGCAPCARLKADIAADQTTQKNLGAFIQLLEGDATKSDTKKSWSHYNYFLLDDKSQAFRFESLKIKSCPTVIVQPPLNKKFGDPSTVVFKREGYDGDPNKLVKDISAAIKAYVAKQSERKAVAASGGHRGLFRRRASFRNPDGSIVTAEFEPYRESRTGGHRQQDVGLDPPWQPAPKVDPTPAPLPGPSPLDLPLEIPPRVVPRPVEPDSAPAETPNQKIPATPEAVIVVDGSVMDGDTQERLRPVLDRLKRDRPGLRVRLQDIRDSKHLPVRRDELPAVLVTADGRVEDKIGGRLLDLFNPKTPPAVEPTNTVPFPFEQWLTTLTSGGSIGAFIAAAIATFAWWRARRGGSAAQIQQLAPVIEGIVTRVVDALKPKPPANPPATT